MRLTPALGLCLALAMPGPALADVREHVYPEMKVGVRDFWTPARMSRAVHRSEPPTASIRTKRNLSHNTPPFVSGEPPSPQPPAHGRLFAVDPVTGQPFACSATVVNAQNLSLVFTAGHCVTVAGQFATNPLFVPAYRDGAQPFGSWTARLGAVDGRWGAVESPSYDFGALVLDTQAGVGIQQVVGGYPVAFNRSPNRVFDVFGYPGNLSGGERLWRCQSRTIGTVDAGPGPDLIALPCDMKFGASGGGWITSGGTLNSVTSRGILRKGFRKVVFGPTFKKAARQVYASLQAQ
jgi:hypothetical protein